MTEQKQLIILENQNHLKVCGVENVVNLTENDVVMVVSGEVLLVKGENLKAEKLSVETGELILTGKVFSLKFDVKKEKQGFFKRIFK